jgi:hypothetical protein
MIYSTAEAVPLPVYGERTCIYILLRELSCDQSCDQSYDYISADQWDEEYVLFLLDCIESPPEEDEEDQVPDAFLNMILSFNQHFQGVCL